MSIPSVADVAEDLELWLAQEAEEPRPECESQWEEPPARCSREAVWKMSFTCRHDLNVCDHHKRKMESYPRFRCPRLGGYAYITGITPLR